MSLRSLLKTPEDRIADAFERIADALDRAFPSPTPSKKGEPTEFFAPTEEELWEQEQEELRRRANGEPSQEEG